MNVEQAIEILTSDAADRSVGYVASRNEHKREDAEALFYLAKLDEPEWTLETWRARLRELDASTEKAASFAERYRSYIDETDTDNY